MKAQHWFGIVLLVLIGYFLGVWFPGMGSKLVSKVTG